MWCFAIAFSANDKDTISVLLFQVRYPKRVQDTGRWSREDRKQYRSSLGTGPPPGNYDLLDNLQDVRTSPDHGIVECDYGNWQDRGTLNVS